MPLSPEAPAWAAEIALAYESTARGQFILSGNVHDRLPVGGSLVNLGGFIEKELLAVFQVIFSFDLGNGLRVTKGADLLDGWSGAKRLDPTIRQPLAAIELVSSFLRYRANLRALGQEKQPIHVACVLRDADDILPATGGGSHELGGKPTPRRGSHCEAALRDLPFVSLIIADNLNDLHPSLALNPRAARVKVPLPDTDMLTRALKLLRRDQGAAFDVSMGDDGKM